MRFVRLLLILFPVAFLAAAASAADRAPPPSLAEQAKAKAAIEEVLGKELAAAKTPVQRGALAKQLLAVGRDTTDLPERFMMWRMACEFGGEGGDLVTALAAAEGLATDYVVDLLAIKVRIFKLADPLPRSAAELRVFHDLVSSAVDDAAAADAYASAVPLAEQLLAIARRSKNNEAIKTATEKSQSIEAAAKGYAAVEGALRTLATKPNDPAANLAAGRYFAFQRRNWARGLPLLALGSDEQLKGAAAADQTPPTTTAERLGVGDQWFDLAEAEKDPRSKEALYARAGHWYRLVLPDLMGLAKSKIETRLAKLPVDPAPLEHIAVAGVREPVLSFTFDRGTFRQKGKRTELVGTLTRGGKKTEFVGVVNGTSFSTGYRGEALKFQKPGDCVDFPEYSFGDEFTIAIWVKPQPKNDIRAVLANKRPGESGFAVNLNTWRSGDRALKLDFSSIPRRIEDSGSPLAVITENQWQQVTMTVSKGGVVIPYCDGRASLSLGIPRDSWRRQGAWRLGDYLGDPVFGFLGEMDELMIFDACLPEAEVRKLAAAKPDAR